MSHDQRIEFPFSRSRLLLVSAIGLTLPLTIWGTVHYAEAGGIGDSVVLGLISPPLLLLDIWAWRRMLTGHPALVLLPDALIEQASLFGAGRLSRADIAGVRSGTSGFWRMVYLDLHSPRLLTPAIPAFLLGRSADALAEEIKRWLQAGPRH